MSNIEQTSRHQIRIPERVNDLRHKPELKKVYGRGRSEGSGSRGSDAEISFGGFIQTASGRAGGLGMPLTNRSR
jgi:hypothetical protein